MIRIPLVMFFSALWLLSLAMLSLPMVLPVGSMALMLRSDSSPRERSDCLDWWILYLDG